ncbi:uncharacterized protein LOC121200036 [Toxotes jaculatrix]|uniref:uncharacterized protein LOC121200036 n=1 Tax=Toxotes jaculatrix TaxID=941984 RepID=UPI001B3AEB14|nr:uncharacterized protein LOC121200036 [Toxotes jaculatrix]
MDEFRRIKMSLYLILVLHFTALTEQHSPSFIIRHGGEITLPCENVTDDEDDCDDTDWVFNCSEQTSAVVLVRSGQTDNSEISKSKSDRLSVAGNCALVIKNVTVKDVGCYTCREPGEQESPGARVHLSVINITEQRSTDKVTLSCSVSTHGNCGHTVMWLFGGKDVDKDNNDLKTSQSECSANVSFTTSHFIYKSQNYELLKCAVKDGYSGKEQQFPFSPPSSGKNKRAPGNKETRTNPEDWWWYIIPAVGLTALLITAVALVRWRKNKGDKTQTDENMADPEDGISYASISHTKMTNSEVRIRGGDYAVTYSTVKVPSSSAGDSTDPCNLYAAI